MVTFDDFLAPDAITAAARNVLRIMLQRPELSVQLVIHDVIYEELSASDVEPDDRFEALRFAIYDRYTALRGASGVDDPGEPDEPDDDSAS